MKRIALILILYSITSNSILSEEQKIEEKNFLLIENKKQEKESKDNLKLGGLIRFRPEMKYNYDFNRSLNDNVNFTGQKIQFYIHKEFNKDLEAKITIQDSRIWGGERGSSTGLSTANDGTRQSTDIREAWLKTKNIFDLPLHLQVGRQILAYGDERLVGSLDWTNVGRSFDGARIILEEKYFTTHLWVMVLGENNSDIAGNTSALGRNTSYNAKFNCPPGAIKACTSVPDAPIRELGDSYFTGFYNTIKLSEILHIDLYYLGLQKKILEANNSVILSQTGTLGSPESRAGRMDILNTYGIRITNKTQQNKKSIQEFDYALEYATQSGRNGNNIRPGWDSLNTQVESTDLLTGNKYKNNIYREKVKYNSYAYAIDLGYTIDTFRIGLGYDVGSGDPNRQDGSISTFQNLFHTNHIWYGMADQVSWVNMKSKSINLTATTQSIGIFRVDYFIVDKDKRQDGWYDVSGNLKTGSSTESFSNNRFDSSSLFTNNGSGSYRPVGSLGKNLFREIDFLWAVSYKSINWSFGYSVIYGGDSIKNQVDDATKLSTAFTKKNFSGIADFGYIMMTYLF